MELLRIGGRRHCPTVICRLHSIYRLRGASFICRGALPGNLTRGNGQGPNAIGLAARQCFVVLLGVTLSHMRENEHNLKAAAVIRMLILLLVRIFIYSASNMWRVSEDLCGTVWNKLNEKVNVRKNYCGMFFIEFRGKLFVSRY